MLPLWIISEDRCRAVEITTGMDLIILHADKPNRVLKIKGMLLMENASLDEMKQQLLEITGLSPEDTCSFQVERDDEVHG